MRLQTCNFLSTCSRLLSKSLRPRPPVVAIMGHVDHGKTTLLDYLRKSSVATHEAGGITQHVGAFSVNIGNQQVVTFLDTPGHAAFSGIRERGANVTDIVVLIIAADDGIMAQTVESIRFAQAAGSSIVVAITKCDRYGPERVAKIKEDLLKHNVVCEDFGGDVQAVAISGLTGMGVDILLESLLLQGDLLELKADPHAPVSGAIIESRIKQGLGESATLLVQQGTLRTGIWIVAEDAICRVRAMINHASRPVANVLPSYPVEVSGWKSLPRVGSKFIEATDESTAETIASEYIIRKEELERRRHQIILKEREAIHNRMWEEKHRAASKESTGPLRHVMSYEEFTVTNDTRPVLNLFIKSDVVGSHEAIATIVEGISSEKVSANIISNTVGPLTETDIRTAKITGSKLILFNLRTPKMLLKVAEKEGVSCKEFNIIYRISDYIIEQLIALIPPQIIETRMGLAKVLKVFFVDDGRQPVAGCQIEDGTILKSREQIKPGIERTSIELQRSDKAVWKGRIASMRHLKKELDSASKGLECGIILDGCREHILPGDHIVCLERSIAKSSL